MEGGVDVGIEVERLGIWRIVIKESGQCREGQSMVGFMQVIEI